jgi:acylphosphatase
MQTIIITVSGKVQGVFYRQSTREKARALSISGFVKNMPDGTVQITATGEPDQLAQLIAWCRQGPPKAVVSGVEIKELDLHEYSGFHIDH